MVERSGSASTDPVVGGGEARVPSALDGERRDVTAPIDGADPVHASDVPGEQRIGALSSGLADDLPVHEPLFERGPLQDAEQAQDGPGRCAAAIRVLHEALGCDLDGVHHGRQHGGFRDASGRIGLPDPTW